MSDSPDVLVLRRGVHGIDMQEYATALRERLPDRDVVLAETPRDEREGIAAAPVVTGIEFDEGLFEYADELGLFCAGSAGVGHLPMDAFAERDVAVTNASGVHGPNVAEYVVGAMLSFVRRFDVARDRKAAREWRHFQVDELAGSTVTVVGLGAIGEAVVERVTPFDVETVGVRYSPEKGGPTDEVIGFDRDAFHDALSRTDFFVLTCPLTDETEGLVDAEAFATLPSDAVLVNVARGPVVDTDALVSALRGNELAGAALDVTDPEPLPEGHPLWHLSNVMLTPHNAGHTPKYVDRLADIVAENAEGYLEQGSAASLRNAVR
jgi:phosphoglycerate dehydrogenase-like enzyme